MVTVMMRAYYSSYHLWAAEHFAALAKKIEEDKRGHRPRFDIKHRAYVTNSIFSAISFLEAAINELYQDVADAHGSYIAGLDSYSKRIMSDFWNLTEGRKERNRSLLSPLEKYQLALAFLGKKKFEEGRQPYQDASLVVKLRNELVHYKPRNLGSGDEHELSKKLRNKFEENPLTGSGNPWFPDKCLGYGCADWAVRSVRAFADDFFARIGVEPNYQRVKFEPSPDEA